MADEKRQAVITGIRRYPVIDLIPDVVVAFRKDIDNIGYMSGRSFFFYPPSISPGVFINGDQLARSRDPFHDQGVDVGRFFRSILFEAGQVPRGNAIPEQYGVGGARRSPVFICGCLAFSLAGPVIVFGRRFCQLDVPLVVSAVSATADVLNNR